MPIQQTGHEEGPARPQVGASKLTSGLAQGKLGVGAPVINKHQAAGVCTCEWGRGGARIRTQGRELLAVFTGPAVPKEEGKKISKLGSG